MDKIKDQLKHCLSEFDIDNFGEKYRGKVRDNFHFDDKIAQSYLLSSIGSNIPKYWAFNKKNEAIDWLSNNANYPLVFKLKGGSGSHHVKLLSSKRLAIAYTKKN